MFGHPDARPEDHNFLTFLNRCISLNIGSINTKLGDFVKLGVHFLSIRINSC